MRFWNRRTTTLVAVGIVCLIVAITAIGGVYSKYKEEIRLSRVDLTVTSSNLADTFTLQEHNAVQNADGSYTLGTQKVTANSYRALPGLTLPKDPYITITGKSKVAAYLYVEVIDKATDFGLSYQLTSDWKDLGMTGAKGGKVYVYTGGGTAAKLLDQNFNISDIYILKDNQVTVDKSAKGLTNVSLEFYGYLGQASLANSAEEVYRTCFGGGN